MLVGFGDFKAVASCTVAFKESEEKEIVLFTGTVPGTIIEPRGCDKFGWDPCFLPLGYDQTFAEMSAELKNSISHRFKAFSQLKKFYLEPEVLPPSSCDESGGR